jgi:hypothetical protein
LQGDVGDGAVAEHPTTRDPSLELRIGKARSDIAVELVNDCGGGTPGRTDPDPTARLVALDKFRDACSAAVRG